MSLKLQKILKNYFKIWSVSFIFNLFLEGTEGVQGPSVPKQDDVAQRTWSPVTSSAVPESAPEEPTNGVVAQAAQKGWKKERNPLNKRVEFILQLGIYIHYMTYTYIHIYMYNLYIYIYLLVWKNHNSKSQSMYCFWKTTKCSTKWILINSLTKQ